MVNNDLYNFIITAEEMNITSAAEKLFITQQTLSEQIKRLERTYGQTFFERKPRLKITLQGERMLAYARKIVAEEEKLQADFERLKNDKSFRIGYSGAKGAMLLSRSLPEFAQKFPGTGVSLISASALLLPKMLESGDIDAYIISSGDYPAGCRGEVLYLSKFKYICRIDLFTQYCDPGKFAGLNYEEKLKTVEKIPFSAAPKNFPLRKTLEAFFKDHHLEQNFTFSATSAAINFDICKLGQAAIVLPEEMFIQFYPSVSADEFVSFDLPDLKEIEPLSFVSKEIGSKINTEEVISILKSHAPKSSK